MREVRPTIRVIKNLPRNTFDDPEPFDLIANQAFDRLDLYGVQHPLLIDARMRFGQGTPDRHGAASREAGRTVYEVRDRQGAAWRGAIVMDAEGDPWLVYVDEHDSFHRHVGERIKSGVCQPKPVEYRIRAREEAAAGATAWKLAVLRVFADGLCEATRTGRQVSVLVPPLAGDDQAELLIEMDHDVPSPSANLAQNHLSMMSGRLKLTHATRAATVEAVTETCLPFLQPDRAEIESVYDKHGNLSMQVTITQAKMIQLLSGEVADGQLSHSGGLPPDRLHYVGIDILTDAYINGHAVRGVCGTWFVPTRGDDANLAVCTRCEAERPAAQLVLDLMQRTG